MEFIEIEGITFRKSSVYALEKGRSNSREKIYIRFTGGDGHLTMDFDTEQERDEEYKRLLMILNQPSKR